MRYQWSNVKHPQTHDHRWEYPEVFTTSTSHYDHIKVEANRSTGQVRLEVKTLRGEHYESILKHGVILREKDIKTGALTDLTEILSIYRKDFSSLPDTPILELIGGNYGIMTEFLGTAERIVIEENSLKKKIVHFFKNIFPDLRKSFRNLFSVFKYYSNSMRWADLFDMALIGSAAYAAFSYNFDFLNTGFTLALSAMATGLIDWLIRRREPWLMKIYASLAVASVAIYRGYFFQ
ncbi:MAG TPA: hypothetical protein PLY93_07700 [Turneriella sp.]|nr:hypothetical protein [Turneriella sp.]